MSAESVWMSGEVTQGDSALAPSQAAIEAKLAQETFMDAIGKWRDYTPREVGELGERWWNALKALNDSIVGES